MVVLYTFQNIGRENLDWFRAEGESGRKRDLIAKKYSPKTQNIDFSSVTFFFPLLADKLGVHSAKSLEHSPIRGSEWGGQNVGCRLKFHYFVGCR